MIRVHPRKSAAKTCLPWWLGLQFSALWLLQIDGSKRARRIEPSSSSWLLLRRLRSQASFTFLMQLRQWRPAVEPDLQGAIREGSPQFEEYKSKIVLDDPEATEAKRALGDIMMTLQTTVRNLTGKTLSGLEIRAAVVDYEGQASEREDCRGDSDTQPELAPNKTMPVAVTLDGMNDTDARANIKMEVAGVQVQRIVL